MACMVNFYRGLQLRNISHLDNAFENSRTRIGKKCTKRLKCMQQVAKNRRLGSKITENAGPKTMGGGRGNSLDAIFTRDFCTHKCEEKPSQSSWRQSVWFYKDRKLGGLWNCKLARYKDHSITALLSIERHDEAVSPDQQLVKAYAWHERMDDKVHQRRYDFKGRMWASLLDIFVK